MRVLVTGAAGRIGSAFVQATSDRYQFRLADRITGSLAPMDGQDVVQLDIADLDACRTACAGMDAVLHLAADPSPEADFYGSLLDNNIKGTYNVFRAAKDAGCRRIVFASSIHAVVGYPADSPIPTDTTVRPLNMYGVSKCFGEAVAAAFAYGEGLSAIAIRIGAYEAPWLQSAATPQNLSVYVSPRDLNQLIVRCLDAPPEITFAVVSGQSNNRNPRLDLTSTRDLLGYTPKTTATSASASPPTQADNRVDGKRRPSVGADRLSALVSNAAAVRGMNGPALRCRSFTPRQSGLTGSGSTAGTTPLRTRRNRSGNRNVPHNASVAIIASAIAPLPRSLNVPASRSPPLKTSATRTSAATTMNPAAHAGHAQSGVRCRNRSPEAAISPRGSLHHASGTRSQPRATRRPVQIAATPTTCTSAVPVAINNTPITIPITGGNNNRVDSDGNGTRGNARSDPIHAQSPAASPHKPPQDSTSRCRPAREPNP